MRQGLLILFLLALVSLMHRLGLDSFFRRWQVLDIAAIFSQWFIHLNGYEQLGLFLAIQIPIVSLSSKSTSSSRSNNSLREATLPLRTAKTNVLSLCGPAEFMRILFVIAVVSIPLIYMDRASDNGIGSWVARFGYALLAVSWMIFAHGRFKDAGWAHSEYPSQYFLVVLVASLMPMVVHWVNAYGALSIFVVLQIPTALMKSIPLPDDE
jgi:hypothetical protein